MNAIFVGGSLHGTVQDVADFRDSSTPDEYEPMDTYGVVTRVLPRPAHISEEKLPDGGRLKCRWEAVFAVGLPDDQETREGLLVVALAKAAGVLFEGAMPEPDPELVAAHPALAPRPRPDGAGRLHIGEYGTYGEV